MVGTISIKVNAARPQAPLPPLFSVKGSPSSLRIMDTPRAIGDWQITSVKLVMKYPNNITTAKNATRVGNVWVATVDGCDTVGKVSNGYEILADGMDEQNNAVQGYVLGRGNLIILDDDTDIARMVGKSTMRYLDDIPATPSKGDTIVVNGALKIYDGSEWFSFDLRDYYNKEQIDAKIEPLDSSISTLTAQVSTMATSLSSISASISSLASTKRDKTDRAWKYTRETDTEMYGVQKFQVTNDTISEYYDLEDFNPATKEWSMYEGQATTTPPPTVKAYSYALYAVIDENNPHTFIDDDEIERQGWPFYRTSDTNNSWLISADDYEYVVRATPRADTSLALDDTVAEKRDYEDLSWKYPMDKDPVRFGVQSFEITYSGNLYDLNSFTSSGVSRTWAQSAAPYGDRFEITATSAHDFTLRDKVTAKTTGFTRLNDSNNSWELQNGQDIYIVLASKRKPATLAIYEPDTSDPDQVVLDFGQSSAGLMLGTNLTASTQAFLTLDDVTLTGTNYVSSRAATRGMANRDVTEPHLKVNGETVPFTREMEAATSQLASEIGTVTASVSAMASSVEANTIAISANTSSISAIVSSLSSYATISQLGETNRKVLMISAQTVSNYQDIIRLQSSVSAMASAISANTSSIAGLASSVSAMTSSIAVKRDYLDLTYNTTIPSETIDNSKLHLENTDAAYNAKLTFTVNDSDAGEWQLEWDDEMGGCWGSWETGFSVWYADDPSTGKFVLYDGADDCLQFDLEDGVNEQTFNYESATLGTTGTLTMTFTGEPAHVVNDNLALQGSVDALASSVAANTSAISANASAIESNASAISAVAGSLNVSGIGCSTIVLSGTYSDSTSFAYNFVIQPSA